MRDVGLLLQVRIRLDFIAKYTNVTPEHRVTTATRHGCDKCVFHNASAAEHHLQTYNLRNQILAEHLFIVNINLTICCQK